MEAHIPLIACERGPVGSVGSMGSKGKVRRMKIRSAAEYKKAMPKSSIEVTSH